MMGTFYKNNYNPELGGGYIGLCWGFLAITFSVFKQSD